MFTGLIEACTPVRRVHSRDRGVRLVIAAPEADFETHRGASIAVSGACLTVAAGADPVSGAERAEPLPGDDLVFDLSAETVERTWFAELAPGRPVNLERALCLGARLDGHLVAGHVDGRGRIVAIEDARDGGRNVEFEVEPGLDRYLVEKGSITLDGISLTVVEPRGRRFSAALIPLTLERTSLGSARPGDPVNVEADMIGKWIERLVSARAT
jgi:riboflavin synthase